MTGIARAQTPGTSPSNPPLLRGRFDINLTSIRHLIRHRFPDLTHISMPNQPLGRGGRGGFEGEVPGGSVPNKPLRLAVWDTLLTLPGPLGAPFRRSGARCPKGPADRALYHDHPHGYSRAQKSRTRKKTNSWERRFPGTFRTNVPLILPIFSVFSVGGGPKVPRNFVPGSFFSYFRWFFSFRIFKGAQTMKCKL